MRLLFLLLLLANVALFAWTWYGPDATSGDGHLLAQQLNPDAIRLLTPEDMARSAGTRRSDAGTAAAPRASCLEWGPHAGADLARAEQLLAPLELGPRLSTRRLEEKAGFWVFMPPSASRQAALQKTEELKQLGVDEFFVLQDDPNQRFAISLGVFRTREAANARLEGLRALGVRTALVGARETQVQKSYLQIRDVPESLAAKLHELKQGFTGSDVQECAGSAEKTGALGAGAIG
ncbi:MAG: hypothetical protein EXR27_11250 [Betaproteobacteria bacterium]|nr:hypothetical protein [Betaproteobacteria bacterium]